MAASRSARGGQETRRSGGMDTIATSMFSTLPSIMVVMSARIRETVP